MIARRVLAPLSASALALALLVGASAPALGASPSPSPSPSSTSSAPPTTVTYGLGPSTKGTLDLRTGYTLLSTRGGVVKDEVAVVNLSSVPLTLNLYAVDAVNGPDGELGLEPAAAETTDAARWVVFDTPTGKPFVKLAPKQTLFVPFRVTIPKGAPVGDHLAGIVVSTVAKGATPGDRGSIVKLEQRVALKMAVRVAGELKAELSVEGLSARYNGTLNPFGRGTAVVTYTVRNTGNVRLGGRQTVGVAGIFGGAVEASDVPDVPLLLPGGSATFTIPVAEVTPQLLMTATVRIFPLAAQGDANPPSEPVTATTQFWAVPWLVVGCLLLIVLLLALLFRRRRRTEPPTGRRVRGSGPAEEALVSAQG